MGSGISVIVPAFNSEATLGRAVGSLAAAAICNLQVVVVDDGSSDSTWKIAMQLASRYPSIEFRILQHEGGLNLGVSQTRNLGIRCSTMEYVAFLDADDSVAPHRFVKSLSILNEYKAVDAVYEAAEVVVDDASQSNQWTTGELFGIQRPLPADLLLKSLLNGTPWHTSAVLLRRSLLQKTGLFHERLSIAEDCHLWMRMVAVGNIVAGDFDCPVSFYHRHAGSLFQPELRRKLDYFLAFSDFYSWMKRNPEKPKVQLSMYDELWSWVDNAMIQFRQANRRDLVFALAFLVCSHQPIFLIRPRIYSHILRSVW